MHSLLIETAAWYPIVVVVVILRCISRWIQLGSMKNYQLQDYIMFFVFIFYTVLIVTINMAYNLDTNLILPSDIPKLTPESIASRIEGSKIVLGVEQSMILTIWGSKACLLCMYMKLTQGIKPQHLIVKLVAVYVGTSFLVMEILYLGVWCRPFSNYWAVPTPNKQCSTATNHLIVNAIFNISSDLMMLFIPMPIVLKAKLPTLKKILLLSVFSLGVFVIASAIANKYYSFTHPFGVMWTYWYIREASTVMYVTNIPMCWPLARKLFGWRSWSGSTPDTNKSRSKTTRKKYLHLVTGSRLGRLKENPIHRTESRGNIIEGNADSSSDRAIALKIWESREVSVSNEKQNPQGERIKNTTTVTVTGSNDNSREHSRNDSSASKGGSGESGICSVNIGFAV